MLLLWLACKLPTYDTSENRPDYTITCDTVTCPNADTVTQYYFSQHIVCIWNCINYEDQYYVYLAMEFNIHDGCYTAYSTSIDPEGACGDWNF